MRIFAIANPKGGAAKTTTTINLAAGLAQREQRVLVVDLDPQASASQWLGISPTRQQVPDILAGAAGLTEAARSTPIGNVAVVAAAPSLHQAEREFARTPGSETVLRTKLRETEGWDYVLIDCPASQNILTVSGIAAAHAVITPMEASVLGVMSLVNLLRVVKDVRTRLAPDLGPTRILPCRVNTRTRHAAEVVDKMREKFGAQVFATLIRENVRLTECPGFRESVFTYAPQSSGAQDYQGVADELIAKEAAIPS